MACLASRSAIQSVVAMNNNQQDRININMDNLFAPVALGMAASVNRLQVVERGLGGRSEPISKTVTAGNAYEIGQTKARAI